MKTLLVAANQVKLFLKTPGVPLLFAAGGLFLIYLFGQAFSALFAATKAGLRAIDYFGVTILTLAVFQGAGIASWGVFKEKRSNVEPRLAVAPISRLELVYGSFLGSFALLFALACLVMALSALLLSVDYGPGPLPALALLGAESFLAAALGVSLSTIVGKEGPATGLMNFIVPVLVFLGGGYAIIPESGFLHEAARFSPLRWVNLAMLQSGRPGPNPYLLPALAFCSAASIVLLAAAGLAARRKA